MAFLRNSQSLLKIGLVIWVYLIFVFFFEHFWSQYKWMKKAIFYLSPIVMIGEFVVLFFAFLAFKNTEYKIGSTAFWAFLTILVLVLLSWGSLFVPMSIS